MKYMADSGQSEYFPVTPRGGKVKKSNVYLIGYMDGKKVGIASHKSLFSGEEYREYITGYRRGVKERDKEAINKSGKR